MPWKSTPAAPTYALEQKDISQVEEGAALSLLDEVQATTDRLCRERLCTIYKSIDFTQGAVVLPTARSVTLWRSPEEWSIVPSPGGGRIKRNQMRALALCATPRLQGELLDFVTKHAAILRHFNLTTSEQYKAPMRKILGPKANILGRDDCVLSKQGGHALLQTRVVLERIGGAVIFDDMSDPSLHADFASTFRLLNVQDVITATNRVTADLMMTVLNRMVRDREPELAPGFFVTLQSPAVPAYKKQQATLVAELQAKPTAESNAALALAPSSPANAKADLKTEGKNVEPPPPLSKKDIARKAKKDVARTSKRSSRIVFDESMTVDVQLCDPEKKPGTSGDADLAEDSGKTEHEDTEPSAEFAEGGLKGRSFQSQLEEERSSFNKRPLLRRMATFEDVSKSGLTPLRPLIDREEMRTLALISHNNMKEEIRKFAIGNKDVLRCFRLTGTASTMKMLSEVLDTDDLGGFECSSGPLGGDAQVGAYICLEKIGGVIFFTDPLSAHPHQADVQFLHRVINSNNVLHATNPSSAHIMITILKEAVMKGRPELIPSFFSTLITSSPFGMDARNLVRVMHWAGRAKKAVARDVEMLANGAEVGEPEATDNRLGNGRDSRASWEKLEPTTRRIAVTTITALVGAGALALGVAAYNSRLKVTPPPPPPTMSARVLAALMRRNA